VQQEEEKPILKNATTVPETFAIVKTITKETGTHLLLQTLVRIFFA